MGIKCLRQRIHVHLEYILRGILLDPLQLAFVATSEPRFDIFRTGIVEAHGEHRIFQLALPDFIQSRLVLGPGGILTVHSYRLFAVEGQRIQIIGDGFQRPGQALFQALLEAIENGITAFQLALAQLVIQDLVIALEVLDVGCQEIQTIGIQVLQVALQYLFGKLIVEIQLAIVILELVSNFFSRFQLLFRRLQVALNIRR